MEQTPATMLADEGADALAIARILGHSKIQMSACYTRATDKAVRGAVERVVEASRGANVLCPKFVPKDERRVE